MQQLRLLALFWTAIAIQAFAAGGGRPVVPQAEEFEGDQDIAGFDDQCPQDHTSPVPQATHGLSSPEPGAAAAASSVVSIPPAVRDITPRAGRLPTRQVTAGQRAAGKKPRAKQHTLLKTSYFSWPPGDPNWVESILSMSKTTSDLEDFIDQASEQGVLTLDQIQHLKAKLREKQA